MIHLALTFAVFSLITWRRTRTPEGRKLFRRAVILWVGISLGAAPGDWLSDPLGSALTVWCGAVLALVFWPLLARLAKVLRLDRVWG